jgi:hypothetical protein
MANGANFANVFKIRNPFGATARRRRRSGLIHVKDADGGWR